MSERQDKRAYLAAWYARHRDEISRKRKLRYHTDMAYQRRVRAARKRYYRRTYVPVPLEERTPPGVPGPETRTVSVNGTTMTVTLHHANALTRALGRPYHTLANWRTLGILPPATYRDRNRHALYTTDQIRAVVETAAECGITPSRNPAAMRKFRVALRARWRALGRAGIERRGVT